MQNSFEDYGLMSVSGHYACFKNCVLESRLLFYSCFEVCELEAVWFLALSTKIANLIACLVSYSLGGIVGVGTIWAFCIHEADVYTHLFLPQVAWKEFRIRGLF